MDQQQRATAAPGKAPGRQNRAGRRWGAGLAVSAVLHLGLFLSITLELTSQTSPRVTPSDSIMQIRLIRQAGGQQNAARRPSPHVSSPAALLTANRPVAVHPPSAQPGAMNAQASGAQADGGANHWGHFFPFDSADCPREDLALLTPAARLLCLKALKRPPLLLGPHVAGDALDQAIGAHQGKASPELKADCPAAPSGPDGVDPGWRLKSECPPSTAAKLPP